MYAIYGNMDPINIPPMLAYIPYMDPMGMGPLLNIIAKSGDFCAPNHVWLPFRVLDKLRD